MLARMEVGMQLTMHQQNALDFARKYQGWHTFAKDNLTKHVIAQLVNKGLLQVNEYNQFSAT